LLSLRLSCAQRLVVDLAGSQARAVMRIEVNLLEHVFHQVLVAVDCNHVTELPLLAWKHGFHDEEIQVRHGVEVHQELEE